MRIPLWCPLVIAALLAVPASASAASYTLDAGDDGLAGAPQPTSPLRFYAPSITIRKGSSVTWDIKGFHTVTFLKRKQKLPVEAAPVPHVITNFNDAAGQPFWFNGLNYAGPTPQVLVTSKQGRSYTGNTYLNTGFPGSPTALKTFKVKFPKEGTFTYYCLVHSGMAGVVKVVGAKAKAQSPRHVRSLVKKLEAADAKKAHQIESLTPPANTVWVGRQVDAVSVNRMFPATLTVPAGTKVTFTARNQNVQEAHTVTWGPEGPQAQQYGGGMQLPGGPPGYIVLSPYAGPYPSEPNTSSITYDGANHGDGFLNLGLLSGSVPAVQVKFTKPGSYHYLCILHPGMQGTINVT
jgi:plastocyanin